MILAYTHPTYSQLKRLACNTFFSLPSEVFIALPLGIYLDDGRTFNFSPRARKIVRLRQDFWTLGRKFCTDWTNIGRSQREFWPGSGI